MTHLTSQARNLSQRRARFEIRRVEYSIMTLIYVYASTRAIVRGDVLSFLLQKDVGTR